MKQLYSRKTFEVWYSVGNLVLPRRIFYLIREMGWNLVAPSSALTQPILKFRVSNESLGYGGCCIRMAVRMVQGWLGFRWICSRVEFRQNRPSIWRNFCRKFKFRFFVKNFVKMMADFQRNRTPEQIHLCPSHPNSHPYATLPIS